MGPWFESKWAHTENQIFWYNILYMKIFSSTNWILGFLFFINLFSLLFRATTQTAMGLIVLIILIGAGSALAAYNVNRIAKSNNSLTSKIYYSLVFSLLLSTLVLFFWSIGPGPLYDHFGLGAVLFILPSAGIILLVGLITGITRSIQLKRIGGPSVNIKALNAKLTIIIVILIFIVSYNPLVANFAKATGSASFCACLAGMDSCISIVTQYGQGQTKAVAADVKSGVSICENSGQCNALADMDVLIFSILNDPQSPDIIYAIKATKYLWRDGQRDSAVPLLANLLNNSNILTVRREALESLLYIASLRPLSDEQQILRSILPLIKNQSGVDDYTAKIEQRLSAKLLIPK